MTTATATVRLSITDMMAVRDMIDQDRAGHLNRLADWVIWANDMSRDEASRDQAHVNALASARLAHDCSRLRATFQRAIDNGHGSLTGDTGA